MSLILAMLVGAAEPATAPQLIAVDPHSMTQKEIRAYNANLDKNDPNFIRCKREVEIGSLVKRTYSCRTNDQWAKADRQGNENARESYDAMTSKSWNTSG